MTFEIYGLENLAKTVYNIFDEDGDRIEGLWVHAYRKIKGKCFSEIGIYQSTPENLDLRSFDQCIKLTRVPGSFMHKIFEELFDTDLSDPELFTNREGRVEEYVLGKGEVFLDNKERLIKQLEMFLSWTLKDFE